MRRRGVGEEEKILDLVAGLVDKSLVVRGEHAGRARHRLLDSIRDFAAERCAEHEDLDRLRARHFDRFLAMAASADDGLRGPDQAEWLARLDAEEDNLRAALRWGMSAGDPAATVVAPPVATWLLAEAGAAAPGHLDECAEAGMLQGRAGGVAFRHELARLAVEQALPPGRRAAAWPGDQGRPPGPTRPTSPPASWRSSRWSPRAPQRRHRQAPVHLRQAPRLRHPEQARSAHPERGGQRGRPPGRRRRLTALGCGLPRLFEAESRRRASLDTL